MAAEYVAGTPLAADAALGIEQVGERCKVRFVHRRLLYGPLAGT
jgi:hypothetical protein